jgi:hypothetical protein
MPSNRLIDRVSAVATQTALEFGVSEDDAAIAGREGLFAFKGLTVALTPVSEEADGSLQLLLTVDSGRFVAMLPTLTPEMALRSSAGLLISFGAALGISPGGTWLVHRCVRLRDDASRDLGDAIRLMPRLLQFAIDN